MNYQNIYQKLILKAKTRPVIKGVYTEKHHILPKCLGGDNSKSNIVRLLAREHYIAHLLLWKLYPDNHKLLHAFKMMSSCSNYEQRNIRVGSRFYEKARKAHAEYCRNLPEEIRKKISTTLKEKYKNGLTPNTKGLRSHVKGEFVHSDDSKRKMSKNRLGKSYEEIYGTEQAVFLRESKKQNTGKKNPNYRELDTELIKQLIDEGKTIQEIKLIVKAPYVTILSKFKQRYEISITDYRNRINTRD